MKKGHSFQHFIF